MVSTALLAAGAILFILWATSYDSWQLREQLKTLSPLALTINFLLIVIGVVLNLGSLKTLFGEVPRRAWKLLGIIVVLGMFLVVVVVPREHRIFYDEDIYQNIAQNIAFLGKSGMCNEGANDYGEYRCYRLEYNKQPNAWPYLLSIVFRVIGSHEGAAFVTCNVMYGLSILTTFLISFLLFGSYLPALYGALAFALIPEGLMWSNTTAVEPSYVLFSGLTILSVLIFTRTRQTRSLFLCVAIAAFMCQFRSESIMLLAVIGLAVVLLSWNELTRGRFYLMISTLFVLLIPHLVHLYSVRGESWGASGPKLASQYFLGNFVTNTLFYLTNDRFPVLFTIFFGLGLLLIRKREEDVQADGGRREAGGTHGFAGLRWLKERTYHWREKTIVGIWFLLSWGIFLFFYAGSYNFGVDVRYSLPSYMPLALMAGYGAACLAHLVRRWLKPQWINPILSILIIYSFVSFLPYIRALTQLAWSARADHRFARIMARELPQDSMVLTHNPNMFLLWGQNAAQASIATQNRRYFEDFFSRYSGGVYFHYNFWCNVDDPLQTSFCKNILRRFDCEPVLSFQERDYTFTLYRMKKERRRRR
jgi:hypothetical protein